MLDITDELKNILKNDYFPRVDELAPKDLIISFPALGLTIETDRIVDDSFSLDEKLCSEEDLVFGSCEASQVKITVADVDQDLKGLWFTISQVVNGTTIPLGTYKVDSCKKQDNLRFKDIIAYDKLADIDIDVSEWYNSLFPTGAETYTLKKFRSLLLAHLGIEEIDQMLPNDDMVVEKTIDPTQISGRAVLEATVELNGAFGHINRQGKFARKVLQPSYGLYPSETLYPSEDLYPVAETDTSYVQEDIVADSVSKAMYEKVHFEEYTVKEIDKLIIRAEEDDIGAIVGGDQRRVIDTQVGTSIQSTKSDDSVVDITKIEGATTVTPANPDLDISPDNVAVIESAKNYDVVAENADGSLSNKITIPFETRSLPNGVKDTIEYIGNGKGKLTQRIEEVVFDGSADEDWSTTSTNVAGFSRNIIKNLKGVIKNVDITVQSSLICTHYKTTTSNTPGTFGRHKGISVNSVGDILIYDEVYNTSDISLFRTWLSLNPITVQYELETPIETIIDLPSLTSYKGITNITTTANPQVNLTVDFYVNPINTYVIEGNFLVFGKSAVELEQIALNAFGNMAKRPYRPYEAQSIGLPYIEVGDALQFATDDVVVGYVLQRTLTGIQALRDTYTAKGNEEREQNFGVNKEIIQLQGRTAILKKNVDEVSVDLSDLEQNVNTSLEITHGEIALKVDKAGVIGAINLSHEEAKISASKINLYGYVTVNDLAGEGSTAINGSNITTGTIDASVVNVINLNADNITTGTIVADSVKSSWIYAGDINANQIKAGTISGDRINGGTISGVTIVSSGPNGSLEIDGAYIQGRNASGSLTLNIGPNYINLSGGISCDTLNGYTPITRGNISDQSVRYASNAGSASMASSAYNISSGVRSAYISVNDNFIPSSPIMYIGSSDNPWAGGYGISGWQTTSDARLKDKIQDIDNRYLEFIKKLSPKRYKMKQGTSGRYHTGFIAQEVERARNECGIDSTEFAGLVKAPVYAEVIKNDKGDIIGYDTTSEIIDYTYHLRYEEIISLLLMYLKDIDARLSALE